MPRSQTSRLAAITLGTTLAGGGLLHLWFHPSAGIHDWAPVTIVIVGAGLAFNEEVVRLIVAWRAGKEPVVPGDDA